MKNRRIFKIILITAVLVIVLSIPAFATAKNGVVKSKANVRSGPGTSYSLVYKNLPANTQIIIIDRVKCNDGTTSKDWYKVEFNYGGKFYENCYISTGLVTVTSDSGISDEVPELYKSYIDNLKKHIRIGILSFYTPVFRGMRCLKMKTLAAEVLFKSLRTIKNTYPRQIKHIIRQQALGHRLTARLGFKRQAMLSHIILIRETF